MKTCKCGNEYDSIDQMCKQCRREINKINYNKRIQSGIPKWFPGEESTRVGMEILKANGIPTCTGSTIGHIWMDLVAWACVPIEVKLCNRLGDDDRFAWKFSTAEMHRGFNGLFMFIARNKTTETDRVFIVPCNVPWIQTNGKPNKTAVTVIFNTDHYNAYMAEELLPYENRYDLIEELRVKASEELKRK